MNLNINDAIKSLSPRRDGSVLVIPRIANVYAASMIDSCNVNSTPFENNISELPLEKLDATIRKDKLKLK